MTKKEWIDTFLGALGIFILLFLMMLLPVDASPRSGITVIMNDLDGAPTAGVCKLIQAPVLYLESNDADIEEQEKTCSLQQNSPISNSKTDIPQSHHEIIKRTIMAECGYNQPDEGVILATDVILNRMTSSKFPDTIPDVIAQPYQFSTYWDGAINRVNDISPQVERIVEHELQYGVSYPNVLFFTAGYYNPYCKPWKKVGDHYFGTEK